ncbi:MAG: hypothetical protein O3A00_27115, partial [Planctomycetota bacterium]|nr:hypothetical protein [Planctomycetota bacterium]
MLFTVSLTAASTSIVTVDYATALDGTATSGVDYQPASGTLTFPAGSTSQTFAVNVFGDTVNEATEEFFVDLSNATNATIGDSYGDGYINNDDSPANLPVASISYVIVSEGNSVTVPAVFTVSLSHASAQSVTMNYATFGQTATSSVDFQAKSGTLTFPAGTTTQQISVNVLDDSINENVEKFQVMLSSPSGAVLGLKQARVELETSEFSSAAGTGP